MPKAMPLLCWDIYLDGYYRMLQKGEDLKQLKSLSKKWNWRTTGWNLEEQVLRKNKVVLLTDPSLVIQFASTNLKDMNGYDPQEVIGKTPRIFQGPLTSEVEKIKIREALKKKVSFKTMVTNYRKDGSIYDCHIEEHPIWNTDGELVHFIAFETLA